MVLAYSVGRASERKVSGKYPIHNSQIKKTKNIRHTREDTRTEVSVEVKRSVEPREGTAREKEREK